MEETGYHEVTGQLLVHDQSDVSEWLVWSGEPRERMAESDNDLIIGMAWWPYCDHTAVGLIMKWMMDGGWMVSNLSREAREIDAVNE